MAREPTAAEALFPHLPHRADDAAKRQDRRPAPSEQPSLAIAMYGHLSPAPPPKVRPALHIRASESVRYGAGYVGYLARR
jgi:hypothetical protein